MRDRNFRPLRALAHSLRALPDSRRERGLLCRELLSRTLWLLRNRNDSHPSKGNQGDGRRPRIAAHDSRVCNRRRWCCASLQGLPTTIRWLLSLSDPTGATLGGGSSGVAEESGTSRRGRSLSKRRGGFYRRRPEALARPLELSKPPPGLGNRLKW